MPRGALLELMGSKKSDGGGGGLTLTYMQSATSNANAAQYTFSAESIGSPDSTRRVVVAVYERAGAGGISAVTIGGVSATIHAQADGGSSHYCAIASAEVPTGTTADIVVDLAGAATRCGIATYTLTGASSSVVDTDTLATTGSVSVDVGSGGAVVAGSYCYWSGGTPSCSWSGVTEADEFVTELSGLIASVAGDEFSTGQTVTATPTWSGGVSTIATAAVAYAPRPQFYDDFSRPNGPLGPNWIDSTLPSGPATISNERLVGNGATTPLHSQEWATPTETLDQYSQITALAMSTASQSRVEVSVRGNGIADNGERYSLHQHYTLGKIILSKALASGLYTDLVSYDHAYVSGMVLRLEVSGNTLTGYLDGSPVLTYTDNSPLTGQYVGCGVSRTNIADDWSGGDL